MLRFHTSLGLAQCNISQISYITGHHDTWQFNMMPAVVCLGLGEVVAGGGGGGEKKGAKKSKMETKKTQGPN